MPRTAKILLLSLVLTGIQASVFADRGVGKKSRSNKITLNIKPANTLRNAINLNLRAGNLRYTGSLLTRQNTMGRSIMTNNLLTFQKGNTIYIVPQKQKLIIPEVKQGYTGLKLVIRSNK